METQKEYNPSTLLEIKTNGNRIPIEPKWQEKTRGGFNSVIFKEFNNQLFGGVEYSGKWYGATWDLDGNFNCLKLNDFWDLLPINNELTTLEKELEEVRSKEKQILEKIEVLKK